MAKLTSDGRDEADSPDAVAREEVSVSSGLRREGTSQVASSSSLPASMLADAPPDVPHWRGLDRSWFWLASVAALLAAVGSAVGLLAGESIYGDETEVLADQAAAQDLVNLLVVVPLTVMLGWLANRGAVRAYLVWVGCLAFTVYNYAIYAFSIHFGPLFLVWVAVLGLTIFALIGGLATTDMAAIKACLAARVVRWPAWFLIAVAGLFALLWLSEIVPDLVAGAPSTSASDWQVPTNPVHVLDLAFFLPATAASGVLLLRGHRLGYATAAGQFTWVALTSLPILVTPLVADARGHQAVWAVAGPIAVILLASIAALLRLLRHTQPATSAAPPGQVSAGR